MGGAFLDVGESVFSDWVALGEAGEPSLTSGTRFPLLMYTPCINSKIWPCVWPQSDSCAHSPSLSLLHSVTLDLP